MHKEKNYQTILKNYMFSNKDAKSLYSIQALVLKYEKPLIKEFYDFIFKFEHAKSFLHDKEILKRHKQGIISWYKNLFCGKYDDNYFNKLDLISEVHVRIGLPAHYVNAAFSFVRGFFKDILIKEKKYEVLSSFDKIIDINLDFLTISYRQEEQSKLIDEVLFLKSVIEQKNIEPFFQAIYETKSLKVDKYECLMRLYKTQTKEYLSIFPYLEISKKVKIYEVLMALMLDKCFEFFSNKDIEFSVNLSYDDISNKKFVSSIYKKLEKFNKPSNIVFEILETDFIEDFTIVEEFATNVRAYSCKIAIDDFGSGFSNMENILKLNPEFIKIDASLIKNIHTSSSSKTIVKNIINMGKELKSKIIAEHVHNEEVFSVLKDMNIDYLQGFYLSKPKKSLIK